MTSGGTSSKSERYRAVLASLAEWDDFLLAESGLPGPRGNLELAQAVADIGDRARFERYLAYDAERAPYGSALEFLAFCGTLGLGRLLAEGDRDVLPVLRRQSVDVRWRVREAVAMALQRWGDTDVSALLLEMQAWAGGGLLERRAAAAALCEPRLLREPQRARQVLALLDGITRSLVGEAERRGEEFRVLRQALGYCWSVAVAALPAEGMTALERWMRSDDPDVRWVVRENLKKKRLARLRAADAPR